MTYRSDHIAYAILRRSNGIVLVTQRHTRTSEPYWVLPGGLVEPRELVIDALVREVKEEAGVNIVSIQHLAFTAQVDRPQRNAQTFAYIFDVGDWHGDLQVNDPDQEVVEVNLIEQTQALHHLQTSPWRAIREPLVAYLRGEIAAGAMWCYREEQSVQQLVWRIDASQNHSHINRAST